MIELFAKTVLDVIKSKGYATFEDRHPFDLNVFGVRSSSTTPNAFDDLVGVVYRDASLEWQLEYWNATTDPGLYYLEHPMRTEGTAILVPGQYRGVYKLDYHRGKYIALCQRSGRVKVYRDNNRDDVLDWNGDTSSGMYGINIHRASARGTSTSVDRWSAGCQVIANPDDFDRLIALARTQIEYHPTWSKFTYTLLEEADFE